MVRFGIGMKQAETRDSWRTQPFDQVSRWDFKVLCRMLNFAVAVNVLGSRMSLAFHLFRRTWGANCGMCCIGYCKYLVQAELGTRYTSCLREFFDFNCGLTHR